MKSKKLDLTEVPVLLYSFEQKCFHIESLFEYLKGQLGTVVSKGKYQGFQLIGVFETELEANNWTETNFDWQNRKFKKNISEKELLRLFNL